MKFNKFVGGMKRILVWFFLPLFFILLLTWLSVPWISQTPFVKRQLVQALQEKIKGEVGYQHLFLGRFGHLRVRDFYWKPLGSVEIHWKVEQAELGSPFSSTPRVNLSQALLASGDETIVSASHVRLDLQKGWKISNIYISLQDILLHTDSLENLIPSRVEDATPEWNIPPHTTLDFENLIIHDSHLPKPLRTHGTIRNGADQSRLMGSFRTLPFNDPHGIVSANVTYEIPEQRTHVQLHFQNFPINVGSPVSTHFQLIGNATATHEPSQIRTAMKTRLRDVAYTSSSLAHVHVPEVTTEFQGQWSSNREPDRATLRLSHAPLTLATAEQTFPVPSGMLEVSVNRANSHFQGQWHLDSLGELAFNSPAWPINATTPIGIEVDAQQRSLEEIAKVLPDQWKEKMRGYRGLLSFEGKSTWQQGELQQADIDFALQQAATDFTSLQVRNADLQGNWSGDAKKGQIEVHASSDISWLREGDHATELEMDPIQLTLDYEEAGKRFALQTNRFQSPLFRDLQIQRNDEGRWSLDTSFSTSENMNDLWHLLFPQTQRDLFGIGDIEIQAQWQDDQGEYRATCPNLTLHSMMQEPSFGVQFEDWQLEGIFGFREESFYTQATINSVSPYLSYDNQDYQWKNKPFRAEVNIFSDNDPPITIEAIPPGEGQLFIDWFSPAKAKMEFRSLDFDSFALPVFLRFILKRDKTHEFLGLRGDGKVDGWLDIEGNDSFSHLKGALTHHQANYVYNGTPALEIENATISIPISFPLQFERLPFDFIDFKSEAIRFDKEKYEAVACTLPMSASMISLPTSFQIKAFGGEAFFHQIHLIDWTEENPDLQSQIDLKNIELPRLARVISLFPALGALNGEIREIAFSRDRFLINGRLDLDVFGGNVLVHDMFIRQQASGEQIVGASVELKSLDLEKLTNYYNLGLMTGSISGFMHNVQILIPPPNSNKMMKPIAFEVEMKTDSQKEKVMSYDALMTFGNLGKSDLMVEGFVKRDKYYYSGLGLRAELDNNRMNIRGLMKNDYVVAPSNVRLNIFGKKFYFSDTVGIRFPQSGRPVDFNAFWNNIVNMTFGEGKPTTKMQGFPNFNPF